MAFIAPTIASRGQSKSWVRGRSFIYAEPSWVSGPNCCDERTSRTRQWRSSGSGGLLRSSVLLVVEGFHDVSNDWAGCFATVFDRILHDRCNHNFRIAPGGKAHEPAV